MGTLVKEDFGRPDRANTMVITIFFQLCIPCFPKKILSIKLKVCFTGHASWLL